MRDAHAKRQKPQPAFDIDDEMEALIKDGRLRKDFKGDPYMTARCYLGRAVSLATNKERWQQSFLSNHRCDLKKQENKVRDVEKRLQKLAPDLARVLAVPVVTGGEKLDPKSELKRCDLAPDARAGVRALADRLRALREKLRQKSEKVFHSVFIEEHVYCWVRLTGDAPGTSNQHFASLVDAAHRTLIAALQPAALRLPFYVEPWDIAAARARDNDEWDHQIRKTLADMAGRPETDRADRYEKGCSPQSVGVQPSPVWREVKHVAAEFHEETKRLNERMREGVDAAAQILWCEFEIAGAELRNRYLDPGTNDPSIRKRPARIERDAPPGSNDPSIEELHARALRVDLEFGFNPAEALAMIWPDGPGYNMWPPTY